MFSLNVARYIDIFFHFSNSLIDKKESRSAENFADQPDEESLAQKRLQSFLQMPNELDTEKRADCFNGKPCSSRNDCCQAMGYTNVCKSGVCKNV